MNKKLLIICLMTTLGFLFCEKSLYKDYSQLLATYVTEGGMVEYPKLSVDLKLAGKVKSEFANVSKESFQQWSTEEKLSFWLNAYNFFAIQMILDHYPIKHQSLWRRIAYPKVSIQQIPDVWKIKKFKALGQLFSLDEIEHQILRKEFDEPRIHFAIVCASIGCPTLNTVIYAPEKIYVQLEEQTRKFIIEKCKYINGVLYLSKIFKWFSEDFSGGDVRSFIGNYSALFSIDKEELLKAQIKYLPYDWSLNEAR